MASAPLFAAILLLRLARPPEPCYADQPLSYWIRQLPCTIPNGDLASWKEVPRMKYMGQLYGSPPASNAAVAVRAIGTNALPYLLRSMGQSDSESKRRVTGVMRVRGMQIPSMVQFSDPMRWQAITAFRILGTNALPAVESLHTLESDPASSVQMAAILVVQPLTTNANASWFQPVLGTNATVGNFR